MLKYKILIIIALFQLAVAAEEVFSSKVPDRTVSMHRCRVIVLTDIGGTDYDDFQSLVHLLVYADCFDIEGLISSPMGSSGRTGHILKVLDIYDKDYTNLKSYSDSYPEPEKLCSITKQGTIESAGMCGFGKPTEGSEWIIQCANRSDNRPLWILVWGGIDDLAQALHDAPSILPKLRVYYIGGPNKKWATTAYDYIAREHPRLWIIEANSTYRGWFVGGNQSGQWGNELFVEKYIAGCGALGEYFAGGVRFKSEVRSQIKMGDTPSVAYLLGNNPENPTMPSWGGSFVRAWDRPRYTFEYTPTEKDKVEAFSIIELIYRVDKNSASGSTATLVVDGQKFPGFSDNERCWHFFFSPKRAKTWEYVIESTISALDGQKGSFTSYFPVPERALQPSDRYPNWWTDNPDSGVAEKGHHGSKTISIWREKFLGDFARRMQRCKNSRINSK